MGKSLDGKNLGKGITQRKDGLYQGTYYMNGTRKFLYDKNLRKLKQRIKEAENNVEQGLDYLNKDMTFGEVYQLWHDNRLIYKGLKLSSVNSYELNYNAVLKNDIGTKKIKDFNKLFCENYLNQLKKDRRGSSRVLITIICQVLEYAVDMELLYANPFRNVRVAKDRSKTIEYLTTKDQEIILNNEKNKMYYNYILLALHTGMRVGEISGLEIKNINFKDNYIYIEKQISYTKNPMTSKQEFMFQSLKSKKSERIIPINKHAKRALKSQIENRKNSMAAKKEFQGLLFLTSKGMPLVASVVDKHLDTLFNRVKDKVSITRLTSHMFRHSFATMCLDANIHSRVIQELLGHSEDRMTELYAHVTKNKITNSLDVLNNVNYYN